MSQKAIDSFGCSCVKTLLESFSITVLVRHNPLGQSRKMCSVLDIAPTNGQAGDRNRSVEKIITAFLDLSYTTQLLALCSFICRILEVIFFFRTIVLLYCILTFLCIRMVDS